MQCWSIHCVFYRNFVLSNFHVFLTPKRGLGTHVLKVGLQTSRRAHCDRTNVPTIAPFRVLEETQRASANRTPCTRETKAGTSQAAEWQYTRGADEAPTLAHRGGSLMPLAAESGPVAVAELERSARAENHRTMTTSAKVIRSQTLLTWRRRWDSAEREAIDCELRHPWL